MTDGCKIDKVRVLLHESMINLLGSLQKLVKTSSSFNQGRLNASVDIIVKL